MGKTKPLPQLNQTQLERGADPSDPVTAFIRTGTVDADATGTQQQVSGPGNQRARTAKDFQRATYYVRPEQARAMKLIAVQEGRNLSEVVREAFDCYLEVNAQKSRM